MVGVMASTLFTIEQIEFIRRLRNTGITKEQVIEAFEQLERLEQEVSGKKPSSSSLSSSSNNNNNNPSSQARMTLTSCSVSSSSCHFENSTSHNNNNNNNDSAGKLCNNLLLYSRSEDKKLNGHFTFANDDSNKKRKKGPGLNITITKVESLPSSSSLNGTNNAIQQHQQQCGGSRPQSNSTSCSEGTENGDCSPRSQNSNASPTSRLPSEITVIPLLSSSITNNSNNTNNGSLSSLNLLEPSSHGNLKSSTPEGVIPLQCLVNPMDFYQDDIYQELEDLKKKSEDQILAEIRNFVMRYNIKQTMIAEMTKMSQAYVSRFFRGDTSDMSDRTKNMFYTWYLTCKNNPWKLAQMCPNSGVKRMVSDSGDLIPLKRERFTFKAAHLAILEKYYEKDPYPDNDTREKIMDECNRAVSKERFLSEKEKLTPSVVSNWFNNRRKEAKKLMRQQHAAAMAASGGSIPAQAMALPFLPSGSATGWSPGMPLTFGNSSNNSTSTTSLAIMTSSGHNQQLQSSAAILQQHLNAMSSNQESNFGGDLSCDNDMNDSDNSRDDDSDGGHFDADNLMIMELHEEPNRLINIKTET